MQHALGELKVVPGFSSGDRNKVAGAVRLGYYSGCIGLRCCGLTSTFTFQDPNPEGHLILTASFKTPRAPVQIPISDFASGLSFNFFCFRLFAIVLLV